MREDFHIDLNINDLSPPQIPIGSNGTTTATLSSPEGIVMFEGKANCHPNDNYCKETGRVLALQDMTRTIDDASIKHELWEVYKNRK
jgi:hypothetical protein